MTEIIDELDELDSMSTDEDYCERCDNSGVILVCWDDICVGRGECIHGDGEIACPDCEGFFL